MMGPMTEARLGSAYLAIRAEAAEAPDAELERQLDAVVDEARRAHPGLNVDPVAFVSFLATRIALESCGPYVADLYLACACATRTPGAAERLEELCVARVGSSIARVDSSPSFIAEILQRVRERLIVGDPPRIAVYGARGSLAAFVRVAAIREALTEKRTQGRGHVDFDDVPERVVEGDATLELVRREHHAEFQQALRTALATLDRRERSALRMSYLDDLTSEQIGRLFQVNRATAARWVVRAEARVRDLTRATLGKRLNLSETETDSLMADMMSTGALTSSMLASSTQPVREAAPDDPGEDAQDPQRRSEEGQG
jgi:RNA polymerase sigma-70 factor (ECF subfamily)